MEEAAVIMSGLEIDRVRQAIECVTNKKMSAGTCHKVVQDYSVPNVSEKVFRIILSYTDYVNRTVWHK